MSDQQPTSPYASGPAGDTWPASAAGTPGGGHPAQLVGAPRGGSDAAGRIGLIVGLVSVSISVVGSIVLRSLIYSGTARFGLFRIGSAVEAIVLFAGYVTALILGIVGARAAQNRVSAGIAIGIGGAGVIGIASSWLLTLLLPLLAGG